MKYRTLYLTPVLLLSCTQATGQNAPSVETADDAPPLAYGLYHLYGSPEEAADHVCDGTEDFMVLYDDGVIVLGCDFGYYRFDGSTLEMETWSIAVPMCDDASTYNGISSWTVDGVDADIVQFTNDGVPFAGRRCGDADPSMLDHLGDLPPSSW